MEDDNNDGAVLAVNEGGDQTQRVPDSDVVAAAADKSGRVRDRRATLVSPIPAMLAASMASVAEGKSTGKGLPLPTGSKGPFETPGRGYTVEVGHAAEPTPVEKVAELIAAAAAFSEARDFHSSARMAEEALSFGESVRTPAVDQLIDEARADFDVIFAAYVGPMTAVPSLARPWAEIITRRLGDSTRSFLRRIDGVRTIEQVLGHSSIPPQHAMRIAASAMRAGFVRLA